MLVRELIHKLLETNIDKEVVFADETPLLKIVELNDYVVVTDEE